MNCRSKLLTASLSVHDRKKQKVYLCGAYIPVVFKSDKFSSQKMTARSNQFPIHVLLLPLVLKQGTHRFMANLELVCSCFFKDQENAAREWEHRQDVPWETAIDFNNIQTIIKIVAEFAVLHFLRRSRFVAAIMRTSILIGFCHPNRCNFSLLKRPEQFYLKLNGISLTSSRKTGRLSDLQQSFFATVAPVNDPFCVRRVRFQRGQQCNRNVLA